MPLTSEARVHLWRREASRPWVLGHRGARYAAPENTFAAFELSRREGADGIEIDVRLDADGEVVVAHDTRLGRVTGRVSNAWVERLPTAELRRFDLGSGERFPLLSEVLEWAHAHEQRVNVEVKSDVRGKRTLIDAVLARLHANPRAARWVILSSFHPGFVRALSQRSELPVCWLVHDRQWLLRHAPAWRALGADGVNAQHTLLSAKSVRRWKAAGALVNTWTVNEPARAVEYARYGVDAIISDTPGRILAAIGSSDLRAVIPGTSTL